MESARNILLIHPDFYEIVEQRAKQVADLADDVDKELVELKYYRDVNIALKRLQFTSQEVLMETCPLYRPNASYMYMYEQHVAIIWDVFGSNRRIRVMSIEGE